MLKTKYCKLTKFAAIILIIFLLGITTPWIAVAEEIMAIQYESEDQATGNTVNELVIISPTTTAPVTVAPGGTVTISFNVRVSRANESIRRQAQILTAGGTLVTQTAEETVAPPSTGWITTPSFNLMSMSITAPGTAGTYQVRVRATQPATQTGWDRTLTVTAAVIVSAPAPVDTTPPVLTLPANITTEGTGPSGSVVNFTVSAHDAVDGPVTATATPASGSLFPLGTTIVNVTAADAAGNAATGSFTVTVHDTTPPVITAPADVNVEGNTTGGATGVALGTPIVTDIVDPSPAVTNNAPAFFPMGQTTVTWTATDASDNSAATTQIVNVVDTTPPVITAPATFNVIVGAPSSLLTGTATDFVDPHPTLTNDAPDFFSLGTTTVTWTARDASGNVATATTTVTATYSFGSIRQPINTDGNSVFQLGRTVPVKFQLRDNDGSFVTNATARIFLTRTSGFVEGQEVEAVSTSAATTDDLFRYCHTENQFIFNWSTRGLERGIWWIWIELNDGTRHSVRVSLR